MNLSDYIPKSIEVFRPPYKPYTASGLLSDAVAGITVAIIALPLAMALAIASGTTPDKGLFTAIVAGFLISALGGSRVAIGGPTGAFVVLVYHVIEDHGYEGLLVATAMAGIILVVMGLAGFGSLIKFIPYPVTTGFTAGIAVVIASTQIKDALGLTMDAVPADFLEKWGAYGEALGSWNPSATALTAGSLAVIAGFRRWAPRIPGAIIAVVASAAIVAWFQLPVETIGSRFGGIPRTLPAPTLPSIDLRLVRDLVPDATTIALLAAIESLLCCVVADGMTGYRHKSNCELVAQGVANLGSVLFGGLPATGAIARTTANIQAGGRTPVAGMIHAAALLVILLALAPLAALIPLPTLSAILLIVAWNMSEIDHFRGLLKAPKSDIAVLLTTFGLTVLIDLTVAVQVGMVLAALLFMRRMSEVTNIQKMAGLDAGEDASAGAERADRAAKERAGVPEGVLVYEINGPFFFGVVDRLADLSMRGAGAPHVFILQMRDVPAIDASGLHALEQFHDRCRRQGADLLVVGLHAQPWMAVRRSGLDDRLGEENLCASLDEALERSRRMLAARAGHARWREDHPR